VRRPQLSQSLISEGDVIMTPLGCTLLNLAITTHVLAPAVGEYRWKADDGIEMIGLSKTRAGTQTKED